MCVCSINAAQFVRRHRPRAATARALTGLHDARMQRHCSNVASLQAPRQLSGVQHIKKLAISVCKERGSEKNARRRPSKEARLSPFDGVQLIGGAE